MLDSPLSVALAVATWALSVSPHAALKAPPGQLGVSDEICSAEAHKIEWTTANNAEGTSGALRIWAPYDQASGYHLSCSRTKDANSQKEILEKCHVTLRATSQNFPPYEENCGQATFRSLTYSAAEKQIRGACNLEEKPCKSEAELCIENGLAALKLYDVCGGGYPQKGFSNKWSTSPTMQKDSVWDIHPLILISVAVGGLAFLGFAQTAWRRQGLSQKRGLYTIQGEESDADAEGHIADGDAEGDILSDSDGDTASRSLLM